MPMIDRTDGELDPAVVFAEDDRIRAEAAAETSKSSELQHATTRCDALIYRRQENARPDSSGYAAVSPIFNGDDGAGGDACEVSEFDAYTMLLLEGLGDALGMIRAEHRREWKAADAELLDQINELEGELKTMTASYQNAKARITELEHQVTTLVATRIASLEKNTKLLVKALPGKTARIAELEGKVKALDMAIAGEPSARDFDSRLAYLETLMSTMFPMPSRLRA